MGGWGEEVRQKESAVGGVHYCYNVNFGHVRGHSKQIVGDQQEHSDKRVLPSVDLSIRAMVTAVVRLGGDLFRVAVVVDIKPTVITGYSSLGPQGSSRSNAITELTSTIYTTSYNRLTYFGYIHIWEKEELGFVLDRTTAFGKISGNTTRRFINSYAIRIQHSLALDSYM